MKNHHQHNHYIPVMTLDVSAANKSSAKIPGLLALCKPLNKIHIHELKFTYTDT